MAGKMASKKKQVRLTHEQLITKMIVIQNRKKK